MNHDFIATNDVIARYVADRLAVEDEQAFEAHLVDCAKCSGEVEQELALRAGLGAAAVERATRPRAAVPPQQKAAPPPGWWTRGIWLQAAAAVLVVVGLGLAFSLARTTAALNSALNERAEQQLRADDAARTAQALEQRITDLEARVNKRSSEPGAVRTPTDPVVPAAVFALTAVRGGDAGAIDTFTLDRGQMGQVVLTVDIPPGEYAVRLIDGTGREVWTGGRFRPSAQDVMAIAVERRVLSDGRYTLDVHGADAAGQAPVARYRFQVSSR
jgi:anti-sigma factor RsiW